MSVYSFPDGHTSDEGENIPKIDTLMFDLDFDGDSDSSPETWMRDMSELLTRSRMIAKALLETGFAKYWRASLSGHKGIHLYLDFNEVKHENGSEAQFRGGMRNYTSDVVDGLIEDTGLSDLDEYIDVSSGRDLARLTRLPNTVHEKATRRFGELRYCVPVTIKELSKIRPQHYIKLTRKQRPIKDSMRRFNNERATEVLSKDIQLATGSGEMSASGSYDPQRIEEYKEDSNEKLDLDTLLFHLKRKPCLLDFRESEEMFSNGQESHIMELNAIAAMSEMDTPIDTMVEFFNVNDDFDEAYTREKVKELIAYDYSTFDCSTILEDAESFCRKGGCHIYNNSPDLQHTTTKATEAR